MGRAALLGIGGIALALTSVAMTHSAEPTLEAPTITVYKSPT